MVATAIEGGCPASASILFAEILTGMGLSRKGVFPA
jgi:hypothetical protein